MTFRSLAAAAMTAALVLSPAAFAQNKPISFTVDNNTGYTLIAVYTGPSTDPNWGPNILDAPTRHGDAVEITINETYGECLYDFRYDFDGGESYEEYEIDICAIDGEAFTLE